MRISNKANRRLHRIGATIKAERMLRGLSHRELMRRTGVSEGGIRAIEEGRAGFTRTLLEVAEYLDLELTLEDRRK